MLVHYSRDPNCGEKVITHLLGIGIAAYETHSLA
jgi:hypothetical protein